MAVGYKIGSVVTEWGTGDFVHALFSNVAYHLEKGVWGAKFPVFMTDFYSGSLDIAKLPAALTELREIRRELAAFPPDSVIWDIENLDRKPPWGADIANTITDLSNYFITSTGRDLLADLEEGFEFAREESSPVEIVKF